jgi:hypothetical protein
MRGKYRKIRERINELKGMGFLLKDCVKITAEEFFLSEARVLDIWRFKKS